MPSDSVSDAAALANELHAFCAAAPHDYPGHNIELFERVESFLRTLIPSDSASDAALAGEPSRAAMEAAVDLEIQMACQSITTRGLALHLDKIAAAFRTPVSWEEAARIIDEHSVDTVKMHGRQNASERAVRDSDAAFVKAAAILHCTREPTIYDAVQARVPLADHAEIGRKVLPLSWEIQKAVVTITSHCAALADHPTRDVEALAGCISQECGVLVDAILSLPAVAVSREEVARNAEYVKDICKRLRAGHQYSGVVDPLDTAAANLIEALYLASLPLQLHDRVQECSADMYALWCDRCHDHPAKCPLKLHDRAAPKGDR